MKITSLTTAMLAAAFMLSLHAVPAQTQPFATAWVSSTGSGTLCTRAAPCATFRAAHDAAPAGGVIKCVDAGSYGGFDTPSTLTITKSISIVCDNTEAEVRTFCFSTFCFGGVTINAGPNDIVTLTGLDMDGSGFGVAGIIFISGAALHVNKVKIRNFRAAPNSGGIYFQPDTYAELYVVDSIITDNGGTGSLSGGIIITPGGSGSVNASINKVRLENNSTGIIVDGTRGTGVAVNATILDTVVAGSQGDGVRAQSGGAAASALFDHSVASGNFGSGLRAVGGAATVRLGDSTIVLNATGVSNAGGVLQSFKNNRISGNLTDGTPVPAVPGVTGTMF
jgi:hypothetical protein